MGVVASLGVSDGLELDREQRFFAVDLRHDAMLLGHVVVIRPHCPTIFRALSTIPAVAESSDSMISARPDVRRLLDFARSGAPGRRRMNAVRTAREVASLLRPMAAKAGVRIEVTSESEEPLVRGDPALEET